jgi:hypothetical protein
MEREMSTERTWTEFEGRRAAVDLAEPRITITKGGTIGINLTAYRLLGEPKRILYVVDNSGKRFGIKPVVTEPPPINSYPVRPQASKRSFNVGAKLFLRWAGIPFGDRVRGYPLRMENGIGIVELEPPPKKTKTG